jgi:hypothetical protein
MMESWSWCVFRFPKSAQPTADERETTIETPHGERDDDERRERVKKKKKQEDNDFPTPRME